jgi:biopolymer transport protein ExbB
VTPKPSELAQGIGTALVTTVVGLWIAIPCIAFYHIVRNRLTRLVGEVGVVSGNLMKRFAGVQVAAKKAEK